MSNTLIYQALICFILLHSQWYCQINHYRWYLVSIWKEWKKIARCGTKIPKTNHKTMISPLLTSPQGCQGCQKIWMTEVKSTLMNWSTKIQPNLKKLWKTIKIVQKLSRFFDFCQFGPNLSAPTHQSVFSLVFQIFWHPSHPWVCVNSRDIIDLRFVFDICTAAPSFKIEAIYHLHWFNIYKKWQYPQ